MKKIWLFFLKICKLLFYFFWKTDKKYFLFKKLWLFFLKICKKIVIISRFFVECSKFDCNYCFSKKNILQMLREFNKKIVKTFQEWVRYFKNYYVHNVLTYVMYVHNIWALAICDGIDNFLKLLIIFIIDNSGLICYLHTYVHTYIT